MGKDEEINFSDVLTGMLYFLSVSFCFPYSFAFVPELILSPRHASLARNDITDRVQTAELGDFHNAMEKKMKAL